MSHTSRPNPDAHAAPGPGEPRVLNFIEQIVEADNASRRAEAANQDHGQNRQKLMVKAA